MSPVQAMTVKKSGQGLGCLYVFFGIFALFGGAFMLFFIVPMVRNIGALAWTPTPCTVLSSAVEESSSSDGSTYRVAVTYSYEVDGRPYTADRYRFLGGSSSGRSGKQKVVDRLSPGTVTTCYVKPGEPAQAVMNRGLGAEYFFALIPGIFVAVGVGGIWFTRRQIKQINVKKAGVPTKPQSALSRALAYESATTLRPKYGPGMRLLGHAVLAAIWNGITGTAIWAVLTQETGNHGCVIAFLSVFALIGALMLIGLPYQFLKLFNPRPALTLDRAGIPLGGSATVSWSFTGAVRRIAKLKIVLEGREQASYRQGTNTKTDTALFASIPVVETEDPIAVHRGRATITLPTNTMHSFEAENNKILWVFKLHGDIPNWPDVEEEIPALVIAREPYA